MNTKTLLCTAAASLALATSALAQGPGYGPGMMDGQGRGMMGAQGPGMMGGQGMMRGQGMMGGAAMDPLAGLDLDDGQREKVLALHETHRQRNWNTLGELQSEMFKLRRLALAEKVDLKAFEEQHRTVDELRRKLAVAHLQARAEVEQLLSPEQRKALRSRMWAGVQDGRGMHGMHGMDGHGMRGMMR